MVWDWTLQRLFPRNSIIVLGLLGPGWISHQLRMVQRNQ
ncbi:hypothetical protein SynROS8604_01119 [Synechococcus sp. ROS8604]|nr:hypothetical protein SynROS8604_01119 [Synechococcus sp. ROS8604]